MKFKSLHFGDRIYPSSQTLFFQNKLSHLTIIYTVIKTRITDKLSNSKIFQNSLENTACKSHQVLDTPSSEPFRITLLNFIID